ncbi:MAG: glycosyltransferase [Reyranellales bacterium]
MVSAATTLSVVIPARNAAETIAETLDSLLAQTRGDWDAIIVDDGSEDTTRQIAEAYAARDRRFRVLSDGRPSEGASAARNRGIAEAKGRWLLFLDSDDWVEPPFVERMVGMLEANPGAKVVYCGGRHVTPDGRRGPSWFNAEMGRTPFEVLARYCSLVIHGFVLDRALVVELGGFDAALRTCEDWDFWHRVARTGAAFLTVPEPLAPYRMSRNSLSTDARTMLSDARITIDRAFGPDPRVPRPAARHAGGADPEMGGTKETALGQFALACAASDIGEGGDGKGFVLPLPDRSENLLEACRISILTGLRHGARILPGDPFGKDPAFVAAVRGLLGEVEHAADRPGLARLLEHALEPDVFGSSRLTEHLVMGRELYIRQNVGCLKPIELPADVDTLHIEFRSATQSLARADVPAFGALSVRELTTIAIDTMSPSVFLKTSGLLRRPRYWLHVALESARLPVDLTHARPRRGPKSVFRPRALARKILVGAALAVATRRGPDVSGQALARLIGQGRAEAAAVAITTPSDAIVPTPCDPGSPHQASRRTYWETVYRTPDPMAYDSDYEQLKYRRTLALLPSEPIGQALEVGCSEGMFTALLASHVGHLTAADISETALRRARQRCREIGNVDFRRLDFFDEELPTNLDLIVCSEVLYYLADRAGLVRVAAKLAAALAPGGHLLAAHGKELKDDPASTGFDWDGPFGGKAIAEALSATPGLALERSLETDLYRIDLFRRLTAHEMPPVPLRDSVELGPPPEPAHARAIVWGGAEARRAEVQARETAAQLAILTYHRVAEGGPPDLARYRVTPAAFAAQMRWLRRHGYHAVTSADVARHLASGQPFKGRPVFITFDDGYRDFHDAAWPILQAHDFCAEVFLVTDRVGGTAEWDVAFGPPAPLMGWAEIQSLAAAGVQFGSHMASHSHAAELGSREMVLEAARSRALIERALGTECLSIAAPFGEVDGRFVSIAAQCGFKVGLTMASGLAQLSDDPLQLPRIEVLGDWSLEAFTGAIRPEL